MDYVVRIVFVIAIGLSSFSYYRYRKKYMKLRKFFTSKGFVDVIKNKNMDGIPEEFRELCLGILEIIAKEYSSEVLNKQMEYSVLQSQINPHFLYNTLDSIRGEALMSDNETIANMTERLSNFFRYCISSKGNFVTIRDEISNVENYFYIQQYRFGEKFQLCCQIEEDCYDYCLPKMTLQPIVENAIYHGLEGTKDGGVVTIQIQENREHLKIVISDNGVGMSDEKVRKINEKFQDDEYFSKLNHMRKKAGIALYNVNQRIKLRYGKEYGMILHSTIMKGTDVTLHIPKKIERNNEELV